MAAVRASLVDFAVLGAGPMIETKIRKDTFRHIEQELYSYHETKKEIIRLQNNLIYASPDPDRTGGGRSNLPGDPTARIATMLASNKLIENLQTIVRAVEAVYEQLPDEKKMLIRLYYWARPKMLTWDGIADRLHVSVKQAQRWRDSIIFDIAERVGWR